MKKVLFVLAILLSVSALGQRRMSEGLKAKNAGNEAYRVKNYALAIIKWEQYFGSGEKGIAEDVNTRILYISSFKYAASESLKRQDYQSAFNYYQKYIEKNGIEAANDKATTFNMALSSRKVNKNDVALIYFQKSIDMGYHADVCKLYMADIYKDLGNEAKMEEILIAAISQYPDSKYLNKMALMLKIPLLKKAAIPFNKANELAKAASTSAPADYFDKLKLASEKFQESIPLFEEVLKYNPKNQQAKDCIKICRDNIKSFNDYKGSLIKR
jgi:tetratricopeptide (TPR) repeat protein